MPSAMAIPARPAPVMARPVVVTSPPKVVTTPKVYKSDTDYNPNLTTTAVVTSAVVASNVDDYDQYQSEADANVAGIFLVIAAATAILITLISRW